MLRYQCLVLDHDDTVVQSMKTLSYPFFVYEMEMFRPGTSITIEEYVRQCYELGFEGLCRQVYGFSDEEMNLEHQMWMDYIRTHIPSPCPGVERLIHRQKEEGGLLCVVSHSSFENITRDYDKHFGIQPDAIYGWDRPKEQRKPNPWPLQDIMSKYSLKPEEILVVDDMKLSCQMTEPLGIQVAFAGWDDLGVPALRQEMAERCAYSFYDVKTLEGFLFDGIPYPAV